VITIEPFAQKHIEDAARLFVSSYKNQKEHIGCLPSNFEKLETVTRLLEGILETHPGVVAISDRRLTGYLTGFIKIPDFKGISLGVYVPEWAHSAENIPGKSFQSMYDSISRDWVSDGCFTHAVTFFASDTTLRDLLYWSGFGLLVVDAISQKEDSCAIVQDANVMGIDFAYTDPSVRELGIGRRILGEILEWGKSKHKTGCAVDFESANVLGRAFWLRHFNAVCFSAIRYVDPRVVRDFHN